jgi:hypothetical protein
VLPPVRVEVAGAGEIRKRHERIDMRNQIIRDIITRMWATGDKHDKRMSEMATEQLDRLEAELARKDAIEAAARLYMKDASDGSTDALTVLGSFNALAAALSPQPGVIGDEKG